MRTRVYCGYEYAIIMTGERRAIYKEVMKKTRNIDSHIILCMVH